MAQISMNQFEQMMADAADKLAHAQTVNAALVAALEAALPRLAHKEGCGRVRPTEEWEEHGSMSFDNCTCEIGIVRAALSLAKGE